MKSKAMPNNPLADEPLAETFYRSKPEKTAPKRAKRAKPKEKPTHYKVCCISLYNEDIEHLEKMVAELKSLGHTKANKSQVIRYALANVDVKKMPKAY